MPFEFSRLQIPEVILVNARRFGDNRGFFMELYQYDAFAESGITCRFVQDNFSHSIKGVLRGLHYQTKPDAQGKLVYAITGEIFDVAVDIRQGSPTFGQWVGETLSEDNGRLLWVPPGFAHGFLVMSDQAKVAYKVTANYSPECDAGIRWNDPVIGIDWPMENPILSVKDAGLPTLQNANNNFIYSR